MTSESIISAWKKNHFKPVYWIEGNEDFFIDEVINYAEHHILTEEQAGFNLTVFYGKDAPWADVLNACRRYPVLSDRQVVLIKEAQQMKDIEKLEAYVEKPNESTVLVIGYKGKTLDGRTKFAKSIKKFGELYTTKKIYENQLPAWVNGYIQSMGLQITPKALTLLVDHVGNDLSRIASEVNKLSLNIPTGGQITEDDIEKYIGISKDYNIYELQAALSYKNPQKVFSIIQYLESNPKIISIQQLIPTLHSYFMKLMSIQQMADKSDKVLYGIFYNNPSAVQSASAALKNYKYYDLERAVLILHHYNLKSVGIDSFTTEPTSLMKEMMFKLME